MLAVYADLASGPLRKATHVEAYISRGRRVGGRLLTRGDPGAQPLDRGPHALHLWYLGEHPDAEVFTSLPRVGQVNAARVLASVATVAKLTTAPKAVAALAGLAPVTKKSGKHKKVIFRWARQGQALRGVGSNGPHKTGGRMT